MKKLTRFLTVFVLSGGFFFAFDAFAQGETPHNLIVASDWGDKGPSPEVMDAIERYPSLKFVVAWPAGVEPSAQMKHLVRARKVEPVMTLADEPVLPLLAGAWASSATATSAWPEDIRDIIARGQESFREAFGRPSAGVYLRSGAFSAEVIPLFTDMAVQWVVVPGQDNKGMYSSVNFLVLAAYSPGTDFSFLSWLSSRRENIVVLLFDAAHPLTAGQIDALGKMQMADSSLKTILPKDVPAGSQDLVIEYESLPLSEEDARPWTQNLIPWERVMQARQALETYKNSGEAKSRTVEMAREELYRLYRYDTLAVLQRAESPEEQQKFLAGISNVYRLIGQPLPDENAAAPIVDSSLPPVFDSSLQIESIPGSISFTIPAEGPVPADRLLSIHTFAVSVTSETVTYTVDVSSFPLAGESRVDIYMDLNNLRNAGLTRFLPGAAGFLKEESAWEYALRFERNQVSLFRAGRYDPVITRKFPVSRLFEISIPRVMLRGNPLYWGYQVITLERKDVSAPWQVSDFLAQDAPSRARLSQQSPLQLPAFRTR